MNERGRYMEQVDTLIWTLTMMPFLITGLFFLIILALNRRSLWSGFALLSWILGTGITVLVILFRYSNWIVEHAIFYQALVAIAIILLIILVMFPFMLFFFLLFEGIRIIRREGFSLSNCLTLGFVFLMMFNFILAPYINVHGNRWINLLFTLLSTITAYFSAQLAIFVFSALVNLVHFGKRKNFDQIVVLGSGIFNDKVPPLLQGRIRKGIQMQKYNPNAFLILSGGQGPGESVPEGKAMKKWALANGADPDRTLSEEESSNTKENLEYSRKLFPKPNGKTAIVSTYYHLFRALLLSKKMNLNALGYGSRTKFYFTINAFLREYIAYISMTRRRQAIVVSIFCLPLIMVSLF